MCYYIIHQFKFAQFITLDKPSPPRELTVVAMTSESGDITWIEPEDNGGSEITGYIIEKKDVTRRSWQDSGKSTELQFTITKIIEGNQYLFRVAAENNYGVSDPIELTEPVIAKNAYGILLLSRSYHDE